MLNKKTLIVLIIAVLILIPVLIYTGYGKKVIHDLTPKQKPSTTSVTINKEKQDLLKSLLKDRKELVEVDQQAKSTLVRQPNPLAMTPEYVIVYNRKEDLFQVEIRTIKISTVRAEVVSWFKTQGFSGAAICTLPIQFTLDKQSSESLKSAGVIFNPLPPGC